VFLSLALSPADRVLSVRGWDIPQISALSHYSGGKAERWEEEREHLGDVVGPSARESLHSEGIFATMHSHLPRMAVG